MKCRNMVRNSDGTYDIIWFGKARKSEKAEYGTLPIVGRGNNSLVVAEYPIIICGFSNVENNTSICDFNIPRYDKQGFQLDLVPGSNGTLSISFYNTDDPTEIYFSQTLQAIADQNIIVRNQIITNSEESKNISFKISGAGIADIKNFKLLLLSELNDSYVEKQEAVAKSLVQRLAVIKNELWYDINYGLPLFDKIRNKAIFDSAILKIINEHEYVRSVVNYKSSVDEKTSTYSFTANIDTIYNETITLTSDYPL